MRSIIRPVENDDERPTQEQLHNGNLINDNNLLLEAAGYDTARLAEIDADAAYALQLQQEEYTKESLMQNQHQFFPFQVEPDNEAAASAPPFFFNSDNPPLTSDGQLAAYLQAEENQTRARYIRPSIPFYPIRQRPHPASPQTSETNESSSIEPIPPRFARFAQRQPSHDEDDSDEDNPYMPIPHPFLQFLASRGQPTPEDFSALLSGLRGRGHRRSGNLQDTEEDFGPEDYEVN